MRSLLPAVLCLVVISGCVADAAPNPSATATPAPTASSSPVPSPTLTALPSATPSPTLPPIASVEPTDPLGPHATTPPPQPFSIDLYREGAFVSEYKRYMCLPAAMQVMINIMTTGPVDTTFETQWRLYQLARTFLINYDSDTGAQPEGWAAGLNAEGWGPYEMAIVPTMEEAIHLAARQLRLTNKPVGLLVWRGAHSWAMSGFVSDIDPLLGDNFVVQGIYAEDVWYPRISSIWGPSFPPDAYYAIEDLHIDYRRYRRPRDPHPDKDGQYVLIVPTLAGEGV